MTANDQICVDKNILVDREPVESSRTVRSNFIFVLPSMSWYCKCYFLCNVSDCGCIRISYLTCAIRAVSATVLSTVTSLSLTG
jgi:hypothetical protein